MLKNLAIVLVVLGLGVKADDQDTAAQVSALKAAGCTRVYEEKASGGRWDRPQLHRMLDQLREGDVIVVWKLDVNGTIPPAAISKSPIVVRSGVPRNGTGELSWTA